MNAALDRLSALQRRKMRIVEAAIACFLENGYHQTGVREIAKKAGISLGNLYNHFSGKEAVLAEIATLDRQETQPYLRMLGDHRRPADTLMRFVRDYATYAAEPENVILTVELISESVHNPEIAALFVENWNDLIEALSGLLRKGAQDGCFRDFADPDEVAELILDAVESYGLRRHLAKTKKKSAIEELKTFVHHATRK